jgi:hypothetical protein
MKYQIHLPLIDLINKSEFNFTTSTSGMCRDKFDKYHIQNTFFISSPNNQIFINSINEIINNCKNKNYGYNEIDITGPCLLTRNIKKIYVNHYKILLNKNITLNWKRKNEIDYIYLRDTNILFASSYIEYRKDQKSYFKLNKMDDYRDAYKNKTIFN